MRSCNISIGCAAERQPTPNGDACAATVCAVWHVPCGDARAARHRDRWQRRSAGAAQNDIEISGYRIEPRDRGGSCRAQVASYRRHERAAGSLRQTAGLLAGCRAGEARCGWRMALHAAGRRASRKRARARKPDSAQPKRCAQRAADAGRYRSRASRVAMDHAARVEPRATWCQRACAAPSPRNGNGFAGRNAAETSPLNVLRCSLPRSRRLIGAPAAKSTFLRSIQNVFGVSADSKK